MSACAIGADLPAGNQSGILWGDSHAQHFLPILHAAAKEAETSILFLNGCLPIVDNKTIFRDYPRIPTYSEHCAAQQNRLIRLLTAKHPDFLLIANAWTGYLDSIRVKHRQQLSRAEAISVMHVGMQRFFNRVREGFNGRIVIAGDVPRPGYDVASCFLRESAGLLKKPCPFYSSQFRMSESQQKALAALEKAVSEKDGSFWNPAAFLCSDGSCPTMIGGDLLYRDNNHIRRNLAAETVSAFISKTQLKAVLVGEKRRKSHVAGPEAGTLR
nr:SGNH hydrolase domain-containing protein [Nitratireductor aquibiodomus]